MNTPKDGHNLKRLEVCAILNISPWIFDELVRDSAFPRIEYNQRVIRYDIDDIMHYRESKKRGGWLPKEEAA